MKILHIRIPGKKRTLFLLIPLVILILFVLSLQVKSGDSDVTTYTIHRDEFIIDIRERGELDAATQEIISVPNRVHGSVRITKLAEDGSMVKEGDLILQFDTSEAENSVIERLNELEDAKTQLASTKASIESNMKQLDSAYKIQQYSYEQSKLRFEMMKYEAEAIRRNEELNFKKVEIALERAEERIESQKIIDNADLSQAEVRVKQAEMRYNEAVDQLNALILRAPKVGLVVLEEIYNWSTRSRDKVKVGDQPHQGMPLMSIPDLSVMLAKTQVNEIDVNRVEAGQKVVITIDALPGQTFYGVVTNVATLARRDEGSEVKVFDVEVTIDDNDVQLKPGMSAQCTIITGRINDQLFVPLNSVFEKEDTTLVYVKNGGFEKRYVRMGKKNRDYIIIEDGLEENEVVALRDPTIPLEELGTNETTASANLGSQNNNH